MFKFFKPFFVRLIGRILFWGHLSQELC